MIHFSGGRLVMKMKKMYIL